MSNYLQVTQRAIERSILNLTRRDKINNKVMGGKNVGARGHYLSSREDKVAMGWAQLETQIGDKRTKRTTEWLQLCQERRRGSKYLRWGRQTRS